LRICQFPMELLGHFLFPIVFFLPACARSSVPYLIGFKG